MLPKLVALLLSFSYFWISTDSATIGLIYKKGDEILASIVEHGLKSEQSSARIFPHNENVLVKEEVDEENTRSYHRAFCRLLSLGIDTFISSAASPYYSILSDYANEYQIPLIAPELPQSISLSSNKYAFGIRPITTRAVLHLFQLYRWNDVVYLYDHDDGPENLSFMFAVGGRVLNLTLDGILKVTSSEEANRYLRKLDKSAKNKSFHVVLDTDSNVASEIIRRHVNDIHVRKKNFHFVLSNPTSDEFLNSQMATFGSINVTAFIVRNQYFDQENFMQQVQSELQQNFDINYYYFYDAALVLQKAVREYNSYRLYQRRFQVEQPANCLDSSQTPRLGGIKLSSLIKEINVTGTTGKIQFENGQRTNFDLNVTQVTPRGFRLIGRWSNGNLYSDSSSGRNQPPALPLIKTNDRVQIVTAINPPYMMLKTSENATSLQGNDQFEGYCKDLIDLLAQDMSFEYDIHLVEDGDYGRYGKSNGRWSGIIGEIIEGKADLGVADMTITGQRQRVVDFTDPFQMVGFSLVMKNPRFVSKMSSLGFFLSAFTADVWICILFAVLLFAVLFHFITKFTGAPDSIESASGIWGRKHAVVVNLWFAFGSSMLQGTGVYPRSISSRFLSGFWWFFTLMLSSMFIASITAQILISWQVDENNSQLSQIKAMSMETIISETVSRGWPKIGLIKRRHAANYIQNSTLPTYKELAKYLNNNPDVIASNEEEGVKRVRESGGDYMFLLDSLTADYYTGRKPCDILSTHDAVLYAGYGLVTSLGSTLSSKVNDALHRIQAKGALGHLYRKWWIESTECKNNIVQNEKERTIHVFSGLLCFLAVGFLILLGVFAIQYIRRDHNKENRRQQLSFEDMNLGQTLPTPPPELLAEPAPMLNLPEYDKNTLL